MSEKGSGILNAIPIIVGPTGSGKTAVALETARRLKSDVISADSRQVYRHMTVGTAKPAGRWVEDASHPLGRYYAVDGVPHHVMDFLEPAEAYSAGMFARQAGEIIERLLAAGRTPVVAGGTGLYLRALVDGLAALPPKDEELRRRLTERAQREGRAALHADLSRVDPASAAKIPPNNIARVVRALEVHALTGRPISWWQQEKTSPSPHPFRWFGLRRPKPRMEEELADRCRRMLAGGLLEETNDLLARGVSPEAPGFQSLGYRQAVAHLQGRLSKEEMEKRFIQETRLYAKRQMTWFRANPRIHWLETPDPADPAAAARAVLAGLSSR